MAIQRLSRNISLTPELGGFIDEQLAAGEYGNASEVVRTALKLLRDQSAALPAVASVAAIEWPVGGGECGAMIRTRDWSATSLGPIDG